ncbi:unnamed protein product [Lampetra fluviatilis]
MDQRVSALRRQAWAEGRGRECTLLETDGQTPESECRRLPAVRARGLAGVGGLPGERQRTDARRRVAPHLPRFTVCSRIMKPVGVSVLPLARARDAVRLRRALWRLCARAGPRVLSVSLRPEDSAVALKGRPLVPYERIHRGHAPRRSRRACAPSGPRCSVEPAGARRTSSALVVRRDWFLGRPGSPWGLRAGGFVPPTGPWWDGVRPPCDRGRETATAPAPLFGGVRGNASPAAVAGPGCPAPRRVRRPVRTVPSASPTTARRSAAGVPPTAGARGPR